MTADTETDRALKLGLLDDLLTVTDAEGKYNGNPPRRVGGFDLIVDNGAVIPPNEPTSMPTMLGAHRSTFYNKIK
jgi:hypothetical protein